MKLKLGCIVGTSLLCFYFYLLYYAAVLITFTCYAQYYTKIFVIKVRLFY